MGRPRKYFPDEVQEHEAPVSDDPLAGVSRADLPALLAQAKSDGNAELVTAILKACSVSG